MKKRHRALRTSRAEGVASAVALLLVAVSGCGAPTVRPNETKEVEYTYEGNVSSRGVTRNVKVVIENGILTSADGAMMAVKVAVKNTGAEPFILEGEDIYLMGSDGSILSTIKTGLKRVEVAPGESGSFQFDPSQYTEKAVAKAEIKKRVKGKLETVFALALPASMAKPKVSAGSGSGRPGGLGKIKWGMSLNAVKALGIAGLRCKRFDEGMMAWALNKNTSEKPGEKCHWECATESELGELLPGVKGRVTIDGKKSLPCATLDDAVDAVDSFDVTCHRSARDMDTCSDTEAKLWAKETMAILVGQIGPPAKTAANDDDSSKWNLPDTVVEHEGLRILVSRPK